jgi:hypothetical protein
VALTSEAVGAVAEQDRQAAVAALKEELQPAAGAAPPALPSPAAPPTFLVSVDATKANVDKQWRDVKVGVVATLGPQSRPQADGRVTLVAGPHRYVAGIEPTDDFFYRLLSLLREAGWSPGSPLSVLLIGDGAPFIWNYSAKLEALGIRVHEVVDYYHASEHIWKVAHAVHGNALSPRAPAAQDEGRRAREYFATNAARMRYPLYAQRGWPLGSGLVESACRLISGLRVKQPGMRWIFTGVRAILTLRATRLSQHGQWADLWESKPLRRRPPVSSLRRTAGHAA